MTTELEIGLYIFMLAGFLGYHIITRVPPLLHTPLMSATNAIAGISLGDFNSIRNCCWALPVLVAGLLVLKL